MRCRACCQRGVRRVTKYSLGIPAQPDTTNPIPMLDGTRFPCRGVLRGQHRTVRAVEHPRCRRPEQHPAKTAGMRGHDDQVEFPFPRRLHDHSSCVTSQEQSRTRTAWKLGLEKKFEIVPCKAPVVLGDLVGPSGVEFEPVMTREIAHVNEGHMRAENLRGSLDIGGHGHTGR